MNATPAAAAAPPSARRGQKKDTVKRGKNAPTPAHFRGRGCRRNGGGCSPQYNHNIRKPFIFNEMLSHAVFILRQLFFARRRINFNYIY